MKKVAIIAAVLTLAAGCGMPSVPEARQEAHQRWDQTRANLLYGLALEQFQCGNLRQAAAKLGEVLSLVPDHREGGILSAKIHIEQGHYSLAASELANLSQGSAGESAELCYLLGVAQENSGQLDAALKSYRRSHELDPSNVSAVTAAAEVLVAQGQTRQAQLYVDSYMQLAGSDPGMYEVAGRLAMMQQDYQKAASYYQEAHDLDLDNHRYAEAAGWAQFLDGKYGQATTTLEALVQSEDYTTPVWVLRTLGDCYMASGNRVRASHAYRQAAETGPEASAAWSDLAKAALAGSDAPQAIAAARKAIRMDSRSPEAVMVLGYAMLLDGQVPKALGVLANAVNRHPRNAELRCVLGRAHAAAGDQKMARQCYVDALRVEPDSYLARCLLNLTSQAGVN